MSSNTEDPEELKAKYAEIAALKKAIQEKQNNKQNHNHVYPSYVYRGGYRGRRATRGLWRGRHITHSYDSRHRNHTLVFNSEGNVEENDGKTGDDGKQSEKYISTVHKSGMSLVNKDIYEKDRERLLKQAENIKDYKEKLKKQARMRVIENRIAKYRTKTDSCDRVKIDGDVFAVTKQGNKLIPLTVPVGEKARNVEWNGKVYLRKHNGSLKCQGGREFRVPAEQCRYFSRTGICQKGSQCKYLHDSSKIRICRAYLSNSCHNKQCLLSHKSNEHNTPICKYYLDAKCFNQGCLYQHHKPKDYDSENVEIWVCRPFAIGGWCDRGKSCPFLHLFNCPDFEEFGDCPRGQSCTLAHPVTRRTQMLMATPNNDSESNVLVESDDETEKPKSTINSYTVDPEVLLRLSKKDKYAFYIDQPAEANPAETEPTEQKDSKYTIFLSDSDQDSEQDSDSSDDSRNQFHNNVKRNDDYIEF